MKDEQYERKGDLMDIMLNDGHFKFDNETIVDECLTFFFAATTTTSMSTQNLICYLN